MTSEQQMEQFSLAHIRAVAAQAGYQVTRDETDTGLDGLLKGDGPGRPRMEFQAKSTSVDIRQGDNLHFPLPVRNYDILRDTNAILPSILIVVLIPRDSSRWTTQTDDQLCLRHCSYWVSLEGQPAVSNTTSITVRVPVANVFDSDQLHMLMNQSVG